MNAAGFAQSSEGVKRLETAANQMVFDTVGGMGMSVQVISPLPAHGSVQVQLIQAGGGGNPHIYQIRYTPNAQFQGLDRFILELNYNGQPPYYQYRAFEVAVKPSLLKAGADYAYTPVNTPVSIPVLDNDQSSHPPVSLSFVALSNQGVAEIQGSELLFTPASGFKGVAHVVYSVCDAAGNCEHGHVNIYVHPAHPPVNDTVWINASVRKPYEFPLRRDGYVLHQPPSKGSASILNNRSVRYTPNSGASGADVFRLLRAENGDTVIQTVLVKIYASPPVNYSAIDDYVSTPRNTPITFNVRSNDIGAMTVRAWNTQGLQGTLSGLSSNGQATFTPNAGFSGVTSFKYTLGNQFQNNVETATVHITVHDAAPSASAFDLFTPEATPLVIRYPAPFEQFELQVLAAPAHGQTSYHPGYSSQTLQGQDVSGYNLLIYTPDNGFTGLDSIQINYCTPTNGACVSAWLRIEVASISVENPPYCLQDCVWPGDMGYDGKVSAADLITQGKFLGRQGPDRAAPPTPWRPQHADDWSVAYLGYPTDLKHLDADGDGMITAADTLFIGQNYGKTHQPLAGAPVSGKGLPFIYQSLNPNPQIGDTVRVKVFLGNHILPVVDMNGFGLNFVVASDIVPANLRMDFDPNAWIARQHPYIHTQHVAGSNRLETAFVLANGLDGSGEGLIGTFSFVIIDMVEITRPPDEFTLVPYVTAEGWAEFADGQRQAAEPTNVFRTGGNSPSDFTSTQSAIKTPQWRVFPNPVAGTLRLQFDELTLIQQADIFNAAGQRVWSMGSRLTQNLEIETGAWASGAYHVRIVTPQGLLSRVFVRL
ncbi:MAG: Ig-like domain-containing protein [Saprospiraceae bacterium]